MAEKTFAFESGKVSIAFPLIGGLGDNVIAKKIFDALIELAPNCAIDIFCINEGVKIMSSAFFGQSKNLNRILDFNSLYKENLNRYDLALCLFGTRGILLERVNPQSLQKKSPELFRSVLAMEEYNKHNLHGIGSPNAVSLRNSDASRILGKNCYWFLSCGGALPIRDDKVNIPLLPEYKAEFERLKLENYITVYSDIEFDFKPPKVKTWPIRHLVEYVALMKKRLPQIEIVQCGGGRDMKIENADRHFLNVDLELTKYILANSLLHVGCEGGLIHLATALGTKCVVLFGFTNVHYFGYDRNINIVSDVCFPCADIWYDCMSRICGRGAKEPPCMLSITPQHVCEVTCNYLKHLTWKINA